MAKNYDELPVEKWNTRHFKQYLESEHRRLYDAMYVPARSHQAEAGLLSNYIGTGPRTKRKIERKVSNAVLKDFIDRCFAEWRPNSQYPNITFFFMHTYMGRHLVAADKAARENDKITQIERDSGDNLTYM